MLQLVEITSFRFRLWWLNHFEGSIGFQLLSDIIESNSKPTFLKPMINSFQTPLKSASIPKVITKPPLEDDDYDDDSPDEAEPNSNNLTNGNHDTNANTQIPTNSESETKPLTFNFSKYESNQFNPFKIPLNTAYHIYQDSEYYTQDNDLQVLDTLKKELSQKLNQTNQLENPSINGGNMPGFPLSLDSDVLSSMPEFDDQNSGMKFLWSKICSNRKLTNLNDRELRNLLNEVKPNRGKWFSYERPHQEKLYTAFETVWKSLNDYGEFAKPFQFRVSKKEAPDYFRVIKNPMDLDTIHTKMKTLQYQSKQQFLDDLELIYTNCFTYNTQPNHYLRKCATAMRKKTDQLSGSIPDIDFAIDDGNKSFLNADDDDDGDRSVLFSDRGAFTPRSAAFSSFSAAPNNQPEDDSLSPNDINSDQKSVEDAQNGLNKIEDAIHRFNQIDLNKGNVDDIMYHLLTRRLVKKIEVFRDHCIQDTVPDLANFMMNWLEENQSQTSKAKTDAQSSNLDDVNFMESESENIEALVTPFGPSVCLEDIISRSRNLEFDQKVFGLVDDSLQSPTQPANQATNGNSKHIVKNMWLDPDILDLTDLNLLKCYPELNPGPNLPELTLFPLSQSQTKSDLNDKSKLITYENYTKGKPIRYGNACSIFNNLDVLKRNRQLYNQILMVRQFRAEEALQWLKQNNNEVNGSQSNFQAPIKISDESPNMDSTTSRALLQRMALTLLAHAGFEAAEPDALEVFTEITAEYLLNIGKTLRTYLDTHCNTLSFEEILLHTLYENGISNVKSLENHYKYDVEKYGSRLKEVNRKLETSLQNILTQPPEDLMTADGDLNLEQNEESFLCGGLGEVTGEDFFGFKELGLDVMAVPSRLILGRKKQAVTTVQETNKEPELEFPPCPPFSPIGPPETQIGLLKQYFEDRLTDPDPQAKLEDEEVPARSRYKLKVPPIGKVGLSQRKRVAEAAIISDQKRLKKRQEMEIRTLKKQKNEEEKMARAQARQEQREIRAKQRQEAAEAKAKAKKAAAEIQAEKQASKATERASSVAASGPPPSADTTFEDEAEESPDPEEAYTSSTTISSIAVESESEAIASATSSEDEMKSAPSNTSKSHHPPLPKIKLKIGKANNVSSPSISYEPPKKSRPPSSNVPRQKPYKSTSSRPPKVYNSSAPYYSSTTSSSETSVSGDTSSTSEDEYDSRPQYSGPTSSKNHKNTGGSRGYKAPPGSAQTKNRYSNVPKVLGKRSGPSNNTDPKKRR